MQVQVCEIGNAQGSVMKIGKHGNRDVFDESGSFIANNASKARMWLREHEGVYVLDALVAAAAEAERRIQEAKQGLQGQVGRR